MQVTLIFLMIHQLSYLKKRTDPTIKGGKENQRYKYNPYTVSLLADPVLSNLWRSVCLWNYLLIGKILGLSLMILILIKARIVLLIIILTINILFLCLSIF